MSEIAAMVAAIPEEVRSCSFPELGDGAPESIATIASTSGYATVHAARASRFHPSSEDEVPASVAMMAATAAGLGCRRVPELGDDAPENIAMMATTIVDVAMQAAADARLNPLSEDDVSERAMMATSCGRSRHP